MPESFIHSDAKIDLYWSLLQDDDEVYAEVEKGIGRTRTDVLTEVDGNLVAIEIQSTRIPLKSILRRMSEHTEIGAHTLWLVTPEALLYDAKVRNLNWVRFIQQLQGGMIFLPSTVKPEQIIPARIDNTLLFQRDKIVVGKRKFLEKREPINLTALRFEKESYFGLNTATWNEWWIERDLELSTLV